ncbi:MAG TPA: hypothetical protein VHU82_15720 [Vicinamibacterales bacterium]|jgi:hypothetical protein|nr:hypothetical protein [Vicinamibacterales bacterium]
MPMIRTLLSVAVLAAGAAFSSNLSLGVPAGDAASVLAAAREALGGGKKLAGVTSFLATGRTRQLRGENLVPIEFEIACELPDKYVRRDEFPAQDLPPAVNGFRGEDAIGPSKTTREEFARLMLGAFAVASPVFPLTFAYAAEAEAPEGKADVLDVSGPANFSARFVVQRETHMPVMLMWQAAAPAGRGGVPGALPGGPGRGTGGPPAEHRLYYADYRAVSGGVKWPFRIRHAVAGATIEETTFDRVTINATIDPKKFEALK